MHYTYLICTSYCTRHSFVSWPVSPIGAVEFRINFGLGDKVIKAGGYEESTAKNESLYQVLLDLLIATIP